MSLDNQTVDAVYNIVNEWREYRDDFSARNGRHSALGLAAETGVKDVNAFAKRIGEYSIRLAQVLHIGSASEADALAELVTNMKATVFGDSSWTKT